MADDVQDVDSGTSPEGAGTGPESDGVAVTDPGLDRPVQNIKAEFDRKFSRLEQSMQQQAVQFQQLAQAIATSQQARPAPDQTRQYTDEELWALAQNGSREANDLYIQRQVARQQQQHTAVRQVHDTIVAQLRALYGKYPMLQDASHPLTQAALQAKQVLLQNNWTNTQATDLEAIKIAIADNPEIIASMVRAPANTAEVGRRGGVNAQTMVDGNTPRRGGTPRQQGPALSDKEKAIAARMGVKNPEKSRERFEKRSQAGRSAVSPTIAMLVREE